MNAPTGRQLALILAGTLITAMVALGIYGLASSPSGARENAPGPAPQSSVASLEADHPARPTLPMAVLPRTTDPVAYARAVAEALFEWDTTSGLLPTDYTTPVLADADPTGEETSGLLADVSTLLPTTEQWLALTEMEVAQTLTIESAAIPGSWSEALAQAGGELRPGTSAVTITGIRSRTGTWDGERSQTMSQVSFTVFLACTPAFARCHVLRLSQLNNPLN